MSPTSQNIAIASYLTPVGWLVALLSRNLCSDHTPFVNTHLRQGLALAIVETLNYVVLQSILDLWVVPQVLYVFILLLLIVGLRNAFMASASPLPIIGKFIDRLFTPLIQ